MNHQLGEPMEAVRLPEVERFKDLVIRSFPAEYATGFPHLPQAERRRTPAIVRRLYATAVKHDDERCLICETVAPTEGRLMIAVETSGNQDIGCVCSACASLGLGPGRHKGEEIRHEGPHAKRSNRAVPRLRA